MAEWWTYSISDFLLFSPRTYYRLLELYNADLWPAQILAILLGTALLALVRVGDRWALRAAALSLAAIWIFVGWVFLLQRYATINWAAEYFAWGFAAQATLLAGAAISIGTPAPAWPREGIGGASHALLFFAIFLQPFIGPLVGRPWVQAEVFGLAPDPTMVATLGFAVVLRQRLAWLLLPLPIVWCAISGATLWAMDAADWFVLPAAGVVALTAAAMRPETFARNTR